MNVVEKYKLFFNWRGIKYENKVATFKRAWFAGPVITSALQVQSNDFLDLDFSLQNNDASLFLPKNFYVARLFWKDVEYKGDTVSLKGCTLSHNVGGTLRNLEDGFKFLIDCKNHEETTHRRFLVYPAWVLKPTDELIQ